MDLFNKKKVKKLEETIINLTKECGKFIEEKNKLEEALLTSKTLEEFYSDYQDTHGLIYPDTNDLDVAEFKVLQGLLKDFLKDSDGNVEYLPGQDIYSLTSKNGKYLVFKCKTFIEDERAYLIRMSFFDGKLPSSKTTYSVSFMWDTKPGAHTTDPEIEKYIENLIQFFNAIISKINTPEEKPTKKTKKSKKSKSKKKK